MTEQIKYGVMSYSKSNNLGDQIQSIAASQKLPVIDCYVDRDFLNQYTPENDTQKLKLILNGWFMAKPENWPPSEAIIPLFTSFHITQDHNTYEKIFSPESIAYFKKHQPIGCRDFYTQGLLESHGIESYYSACLTLTIKNEFAHLPKSDKVLLVDVLYKTQKRKRDIKGAIKKKWLLKQIIPENILLNAEHICQDAPKNMPENEKIKLAQKLLQQYAQAKFVITSRIHCALPCLALGTPVLFVDGNLNHLTDTTRFKGILEHLNVYDASPLIQTYPGMLKALTERPVFSNPTDIDWNNFPSNPDSHLEIAKKLTEQCQEFIREV